jgi:hypothetical protein
MMLFRARVILGPSFVSSRFCARRQNGTALRSFALPFMFRLVRLSPTGSCVSHALTARPMRIAAVGP